MVSISFIICTYNQPLLIQRCLKSILKQRFSGKMEILLVDGGSNKETLKLLNNYKRKFKNIKILNNKEHLPEGYGRGKWLGWKKAKGEYIAIIDQDNEIQGKDWIEQMISPLSGKKVFGSVCKMIIKKQDSLTNKYIALQGTDPFFAYRSLDGIINLKKIAKNNKNHLLVVLNKENPLITGGNCFVYKKSYLQKLGGYTQDTENILRLVNNGYNEVAIPKKAYTHHLATTSFLDFIKKKKRWALFYRPRMTPKFSYNPSTKEARREFLKNMFRIITIVPNIFIGIKKFIETREKAWLIHPILPPITFAIYFFYCFLRIKFKK